MNKVQEEIIISSIKMNKRYLKESIANENRHELYLKEARDRTQAFKQIIETLKEGL